VSWQLWSLFAVTETVLCFVPGPAVLLVLSQAISRGAKLALWSILGILAANTLCFVLSATGIGAALLTSYKLFFAIKWIGAIYLVWLGFTAFFRKSRLLSLSGVAEQGPREPRMFANGFILQMSNPKALIFFSALVPQFIDPHAPIWPQMLILALTSVVIEFVVQFFYATLAGRATAFVKRPRFAAITDRVAGTLLIAAGAGLAAIRRA